MKYVIHLQLYCNEAANKKKKYHLLQNITQAMVYVPLLQGNVIYNVEILLNSDFSNISALKRRYTL